MATATKLTYAERAQLCRNPAAKKLLTLVDEKKTNLAVNPDVTSAEELLTLADRVGPEICLLKTHIDMVSDFTPALTDGLQELATKHRFLIFEDRKFGDIGHIAKHQYCGGVYNIASWANITNAHPVAGPGVIEGLREVGEPLGRGVLLVAEMSSQGSLATGSYTQTSVAMAKAYPEFVIGFVCQQKLSDDPTHIHLTPGVNLATKGDNLGQQYNTPEGVIGQRGSDIAIVGRGIIKAPNPTEAAEQYKEACWQAYLTRT